MSVQVEENALQEIIAYVVGSLMENMLDLNAQILHVMALYQQIPKYVKAMVNVFPYTNVVAMWDIVVRSVKSITIHHHRVVIISGWHLALHLGWDSRVASYVYFVVSL
jgi:hypothetical protein